MTFDSFMARSSTSRPGRLKKLRWQLPSFMAFLCEQQGTSNRKAFVEQQLKQAVQSTDFSDARFILAIEAVLSRMHSCLRLNFYSTSCGLDNRYPWLSVSRSVEPAKTYLRSAASCLGVAGWSVSLSRKFPSHRNKDNAFLKPSSTHHRPQLNLLH
jgi:hypothetical protein